MLPSSLVFGVVVVLALAGLAVLAVVGLRRLGLAGDPLQDRLHTYAVLDGPAARSTQRSRRPFWGRLRLRLNAMLSTLASTNLGLQLARANWPITVPEYILIRFGSTLVAFALGWALGRSPVSGLGLGLFAYLIPPLLLRRSTVRRQAKFARQLNDVLVLMAGAARAGHSLLQAVELVVREMTPPASEEFQRVVREVGLGRRLPEALSHMALRLQNEELNLVVTSIDIHYHVGGNIAAILSAVNETIRERLRLFGEIRVLTTQQRYSSYLLSVLPFFVGGALFFMNPDYIMRLFAPETVCFPIGALFGVLLGHVVIQRISKIEV